MLEAASGTDAHTIEAVLLAREAIGSTGVGGAVALPHARLHELEHTHAVFVRFASPIAFEAMDDRPVDLLCAVLAPDEPNAAMLEVVGAVARVLRNADKSAALRAANDATEAWKVLIHHDATA